MADELTPVAWLLTHPTEPDEIGFSLAGGLPPLTDADRDAGWTETPLYTRPTPQPAGDVAELVEELRFLSDARQQMGFDRAGAAMDRAAEALTSLSSDPVKQMTHAETIEAVQCLLERGKARLGSEGYLELVLETEPVKQPAPDDVVEALLRLAQSAFFSDAAPSAAEFYEPAEASAMDWLRERASELLTAFQPHITALVEQARREGEAAGAANTWERKLKRKTAIRV